MQDLTRTLASYDPELLRVIANRWDVDLTARDPKQAAIYLAQNMLKAEKVSDAWDRLTDEQRGALQALLGAGGKMPGAVFSRLYGEIRAMGPGRLEREKPYLAPVSLAEALYYRGLIGMTYGEAEKTGKVNQSFTYVPADLIPLMPVHRTGYHVEETAPTVSSAPEPAQVRRSDTAIVDDLTTFLAYCQLTDVALVNASVDAEHQRALKAFLLGSSSSARISLMIALAAGLGIAGEIEDALRPISGAARKWMDLPRAQQVRTLAEAWRDSLIYNELFFTPGLKPEAANWQNDPLLARQTVFTFLESVPENDWWPVDAFISAVKEEEPDFQRPAGNYDSWYIRDGQSGEYLRGFESWDRVDGAVLRFILTGPMWGLGLIDTADGGKACRLTAYGRAFIGITDWPKDAPKENGESSEVLFTIQPDGTCEVPRAASRYNRFQLARLTEWISAGDPYRYKISTAGLQQATRQNIKVEAVLTFLKRGTGDQIPAMVLNLIETWGQAGNERASIADLTVLRVPSAELLETIQSMPALRRYLGATLGPTAVIVRPGQWQDLANALEANGVLVDVDAPNGTGK